MALNDIGPRIDALMALRGASSERVAAAVDISRAQVDHVRSGRRLPTLGTLRAMLDALNAELVITWQLRDTRLVPVDAPAELAPALRRLAELGPDDREAVARLLSLYLDGSPAVRALLVGMSRSPVAVPEAANRRGTG